MANEVEIQREYYRKTAENYDVGHTEREHIVAGHLLAAFIRLHDIKTVLDVGAGTGRAMRFLREHCPDVSVKGIEPIAELRKIGHRNGISKDDLIAGDGLNISFPDSSFDLVCEFAVLHHVRRPQDMVAQMNRVARRGVAISDANLMGQGSAPVRALKTALFQAGLWPMVNWLKTGGKGYTISEGDGLAYSYSVYQNLAQLKGHWEQVNVVSTYPSQDGFFGPRMSAPHVLALAFGAREPK